MLHPHGDEEDQEGPKESCFEEGPDKEVRFEEDPDEEVRFEEDPVHGGSPR